MRHTVLIPLPDGEDSPGKEEGGLWQVAAFQPRPPPPELYPCLYKDVSLPPSLRGSSSSPQPFSPITLLSQHSYDVSEGLDTNTARAVLAAVRRL
jgi:hypothetical protein